MLQAGQKEATGPLPTKHKIALATPPHPGQDGRQRAAHRYAGNQLALDLPRGRQVYLVIT